MRPGMLFFFIAGQVDKIGGMRGDFLYARLFSCFFKKGYIRLSDGSLFPGPGIFGKYLKGGAVQGLCCIDRMVEPSGDGKMGAEQA
jgi:hypothetical protein